jgi:hypothetical protein
MRLRIQYDADWLNSNKLLTELNFLPVNLSTTGIVNFLPLSLNKNKSRS